MSMLLQLVHWPVLWGNPVVVMPKFEIQALCTYVQRYRGTFLMLVPPIALQLARDPIVDKFDVSSLRIIISGAAPLGPELEQELATRLPKATVLQALRQVSLSMLSFGLGAIFESAVSSACSRTFSKLTRTPLVRSTASPRAPRRRTWASSLSAARSARSCR